MITEHIVHGSNETTFHDFSISTEGMTIIVSPGEYYRADSLAFSKNVPTTFEIPAENKNYQICITENGIVLFSYTDEIGYVIVPGLIDTLAWFKLNGETDLANVEIHFVKLVLSN